MSNERANPDYGGRRKARLHHGGPVTFTESPKERIKEERREERFLRGPQSRSFEFYSALRIFWELIKGFRFLHFAGPCVTIFGSARFSEGHEYYELTREVGREIAKAGFTVVTGGGPGLMEAANRGAKEAGGHSLGCNIHLPVEQRPNPFLDRCMEFRHFFVRKLMLAKYSYAFVAMPGGYGTLDEFFEIATLIQTGKMKLFPLVLMGREYWGPLVGFIKERLVACGTINERDFTRILITDSPGEVASHVREAGLQQFGLSYGPKARRRWLLLER